MSLAVRSDGMIHLKSTLAVSALLLGGLVAASPFPYPSAPEPERPRVTEEVRAAMADAARATPDAWSDPPPRTAIAEAPTPAAEPEAPAKTAQAPASAADPAPPAPPASAQAARTKAAEAAQRRRTAQAAARKRQVAAKQAASTPAGTPAGERQDAAPGAAAPARATGPIADILRGLGIGGNG